jgi:hypothetical protein
MIRLMMANIGKRVISVSRVTSRGCALAPKHVHKIAPFRSSFAASRSL